LYDSFAKQLSHDAFLNYGICWFDEDVIDLQRVNLGRCFEVERFNYSYWLN
jgi:hypothetical protein